MERMLKQSQGLLKGIKLFPFRTSFPPKKPNTSRAAKSISNYYMVDLKSLFLSIGQPLTAVKFLRISPFSSAISFGITIHSCEEAGPCFSKATDSIPSTY